LGDNSRSLAKRLARPFLNPLLARINSLAQRVDAVEAHTQAAQARMAELAHAEEQLHVRIRELLEAKQLIEAVEPRTANLERQIQATQKTVDDLLDAVSAQNAVARESRRESIRVHSDLERRIEFVRREIMLEARYRAEPGDVGEPDPVIVNEDKVRVRPLRVNLGCGHIPIDEYVNTDARPLPGVDVVAEVGKLPFDEGSLDEIRSAHLLEHFPGPRLDHLIGYWYSLLRPGGTFTAVVPDAESMIRSFVTGDIPWADLKEVTYGGQEYAGDFHFTMFSQDELVSTLTDAGFVDVKVVDSGRRNGASLEMEVVAFKPSGD
jgi:predicted SAM-dependent methyltransferase